MTPRVVVVAVAGLGLALAGGCATPPTASPLPVPASPPPKPAAPERVMSTEAARATLQAELHLQDGDVPAAVEDWQIAARADDASPYLKVRLGESLLLLGDAEGAAAAARAGLTLADAAAPRGEHALAALRLLAQARFELGALDDGEVLLREALSRAPGDPRASSLLAERLVARGALDDAEAVVERWMQQDPGTAGLVTLARVFAERRQIERAFRHLDAALARVVADEPALMLKRDLLLALGRDEQNVAIARTLLGARGDGPETRHALLVALALHDPVAARATAAGLIAEDPGERTRLLIADAFEQAGLLDDAASTLRDVTSTPSSPVRPSPLMLLELARVELGRRQPKAAAGIACRAADVVDPADHRMADYAAALCARADVELGRAAPAVSRLVGRAVVRPPRARPLNALASLMPLVADSASLDVARTAARDVLAVAAGPAEAPEARDIEDVVAVVLAAVAVLEAGGDHEGARAAAEALLAKRPADRTVILGHARLLEQQATTDGEALAAVELVERLVDRVGADVDTLNFMAFALAERRLRTDDARAFAWRAALLEPLSGYILDTLGWAELAAGDAEAAVVTLRRADRLAPGEGEIWFHIAAAEKARGQRDLAKAAVATALSLLPPDDPLRARAAALMSE